MALKKCKQSESWSFVIELFESHCEQYDRGNMFQIWKPFYQLNQFMGTCTLGCYFLIILILLHRLNNRSNHNYIRSNSYIWEQSIATVNFVHERILNFTFSKNNKYTVGIYSLYFINILIPLPQSKLQLHHLT